MITIILTGLGLAVQAPAETDQNPNEVICRPTGQYSEGQIINIGLSCPSVDTDPDGFIAYLRTMLDAMPTAVTLPEVENVAINDTIPMVYGETGWRLAEPTHLISVAPLFPLDAARNGWSGACVSRFHLSEPQKIEIDETICVRDGRAETRTTRLFIQEMEAALDHFIWLPFPGNETACGTMKMDFMLTRLRGEEEEAPSLMPDASAHLSC